MSDYKSVPVEVARQIANDFSKDIVVICAWDKEYKKLHTTTYGKEAVDKISAANAGEIATKALGFDLAKSHPYEDFRTLDAARNAQIRELAPGIIHALRSYQFGNTAPDLAKDFADELEYLTTPSK